MMMNIIPISSQAITPGQVGGGPNLLSPGEKAAKSFGDMFKEAVANIDDLEAIKRQDAYALAVGEVDDLAQIWTNSQKSEIAVQLMVQMRNKLLESYTEIMRMNI